MATLDAFHVNSYERGDLPEDADCSHEVLRTAAGLTLSSSSIATKGAAGWQAEGHEGLSIGVVRGRMRFDLANRWETEIDGGFGFCLSTPEPLMTSHLIEAGSRLRGVFLHVPYASLEKYGITTPIATSSPHGPDFRSWSPARLLDGIAQQIADCAYEGALRTLFLEAKSLELLVVALAAGGLNGGAASAKRALSRNEIERLTHGRDIVLASLHAPPSLNDLARRIGMSTSRLTAGFRQLFSMSVVEFIQENRLATARAAISSGRASISQAASEVGYTPAHFSTLFRRRYGHPPSTITRR